MLTKPVLAGRTASAQQKRTVAADAGRTTSKRLVLSPYIDVRRHANWGASVPAK